MRHQNLLFVGMALGVTVGLLKPPESVVWWCDLFGTTVFIGALKMIVAPLILFSILAGMVLTSPVIGGMGFDASGALILAATVAAGVAAVIAAGALSRPLLRSVMHDVSPRPD